MQNSVWIGLLRLMPPAVHGSLMILTRIGQEIAVQDVFRLEDHFVVLRGRMAGTTDAGRVFIMPYDEIHYLGFQKPMKAAEIAAIFSGERASTETVEPSRPQAAAPAPEPAAPVVSAPSPPAPEPTSVAAASVEVPRPRSKLVLLERVRARIAASAQAKAASATGRNDAVAKG